MRLRAGAAPCVLLFAAAPLAIAADLYSLTDLGYPPGLSGTASGFEINEAGVVVGQVNTPGSRAFIWDNVNGMRHVPLLPGRNVSSARGVNDLNQVVGFAVSASNPQRGYVWNASNGVLRDLGWLPGGSYSTASAINNAGQIVGNATTANSNVAVLWDAAGNIQSLGLLPGGVDDSFARDINELGQVVGGSEVSDQVFHGFIWDAVNGMRDIGELPGGEVWTGPEAINDLGVVVGDSYDARGRRAFRWDAANGMIDLGNLPGGEDSTIAYNVNNAGEIVGLSAGRGFVWDATHGMRDLNSLLDASGSGWSMSRCYGINEAGRIVGEAYRGNVRHAVMLTPIPEPATLAMVGLTALLLQSRRR